MLEYLLPQSSPFATTGTFPRAPKPLTQRLAQSSKPLCLMDKPLPFMGAETSKQPTVVSVEQQPASPPGLIFTSRPLPFSSQDFAGCHCRPLPQTLQFTPLLMQKLSPSPARTEWHNLRTQCLVCVQGLHGVSGGSIMDS